MTTAAIYARVSSARQAKDETIGSQLAAVTSHAEQQGLDVLPGWVFTDDGHSGASLVRPGLERLRDLIAQVPSRWWCVTRRTVSPASSPTRRC